MNRSSRDSLVGARTFNPILSQHRRGHSLTLTGGPHKDSSPSSAAVADENHLDLFSKSRRSLSVTSSDESSDGTFRPSLLSRIALLLLLLQLSLCFTPRTNTAMGDFLPHTFCRHISFSDQTLSVPSKRCRSQFRLCDFNWFFFFFLENSFGEIREIISWIGEGVEEWH